VILRRRFAVLKRWRVCVEGDVPHVTHTQRSESVVVLQVAERPLDSGTTRDSSDQLDLYVRVGRSPDGQVKIKLPPLLAGVRGIRAGDLDHRASDFLHGKARPEEMSAQVG
jgi:hypothetical protein